MTNKNILITGGNSRFCRFLKTELKSHKTFFTKKSQFNILKLNQMERYVKKKN